MKVHSVGSWVQGWDVVNCTSCNRRNKANDKHKLMFTDTTGEVRTVSSVSTLFSVFLPQRSS